MRILSEAAGIQVFRPSFQQFTERRKNRDAEKNMEEECLRPESFGSHNTDFRGIWDLSSEIMEQRFKTDGDAENGTQFDASIAFKRNNNFVFMLTRRIDWVPSLNFYQDARNFDKSTMLSLLRGNIWLKNPLNVRLKRDRLIKMQDW